jgi:hypothetical protein
MQITNLGLILLAPYIAITSLQAQDEASQWPDLRHATKGEVQDFANDEGSRLWVTLKPQIIKQGLSAVDDILEQQAKECHLTGGMVDVYIIEAEDVILQRMRTNP